MGVGAAGEGEGHGSGLAAPGEGRGVGARLVGRGAAARIIGDIGGRWQPLIFGNPAGNFGLLGIAVADQAGGGKDGQGDPINIISIRAIIIRTATGLDCVFITNIIPCMGVAAALGETLHLTDIVSIITNVAIPNACTSIFYLEVSIGTRHLRQRGRRGKHPRQQADGHRQRQQDAEQGFYLVFHGFSSPLFVLRLFWPPCAMIYRKPTEQTGHITSPARADGYLSRRKYAVFARAKTARLCLCCAVLCERSPVPHGRQVLSAFLKSVWLGS